MASSSKPIPFIEENYGLAFHQSMQQLVDEIHKETLNLSHFINVFYRLMQSKVDPPIETIWIYSALSFRSRKKANQDLSDHILIVKELFQLISRCSGPCSASKSIALLAPVVFQVYNLVVELLGKDLGARRVKKAAKEAKSLIGEIIGYVSVCCGKDVSKESDSNLSVSFLDLASLWIDGNDGLKGFLPLTSDEIYKEISVGGSTVANLAGVVISEVFLLKLCLDLRIGNRGEALEKELRSWIVGSITGLQSFYFFETLVRMLLEPALPVTSLLKRKKLEKWRKSAKNDRKVIGSVICPNHCPNQAEAETWRQQTEVIGPVICPNHSQKLPKSLAEIA
ncbi:uncharacterized protein LOC110610931 isoform X1 [Manihot esculenta]|uniref:Uncharacterized protein n=1 Tax=Manihot esculenta TaxID=3983 RepID=A0ACB7HWU6_MANES|nr:uncharacterized protein LOC110610931 isoform X1 [Manihot esculenta]KAG8656997.1 hypothetical protein MANES_03G030833v8 [Manihot esculenta]